jgi:hypothetical protein
MTYAACLRTFQDGSATLEPLADEARRAWAPGLTVTIPPGNLSVASICCPRGIRMAKLALIYGMRLLPEEDLGEVRDATVVLKNGKTARIAMHLIEGSKEEIEATFHQSVQAFFEMYPEI